jgi:hypothetical protein
MDELTGLVVTYDVIYRFFRTDYEIKTEVERQVNDLGDYLAEHGYIIVRPCGGFSARGASGALPALEFPFTQVFQRITGKTYESRTSFEGAMGKAGVWDRLKGPFATYTVIGLALGVVATLVLAVVASPLAGVLSALAGLVTGWVAGRVVALLLNKDVFDVSDVSWSAPSSAAKEEFVVAYLFKTLMPSRKQRYLLWLRGVGMGIGSHAGGFPPFIGLTGLDDADTTVKDSYIRWFSTWPKTGEAITPNNHQEQANTGLKRGVAAALGEGPNAERLLREFLDQFHTVLTHLGDVMPTSVNRDLNRPVRPDDGEAEQRRPGRQGHLSVANDQDHPERALHERSREGLDYMVGLALAWPSATATWAGPSRRTYPTLPQARTSSRCRRSSCRPACTMCWGP